MVHQQGHLKHFVGLVSNSVGAVVVHKLIPEQLQHL